MSPKNIKIALFAALALAQLYFPANMIWQQQSTIKQGKAFRFETAPVDPNDPFRGKYITLWFTAEDFHTDLVADYPEYGKVFVLLGEDEKGLAKITDIQIEKPENTSDYFIAEIAYRDISNNVLELNFPFDKYYMEESKAYEAELAHRRARRDSTQQTYALVIVNEGKTALEDVVLDGVSIKEVVEQVVED